MDTDKMIRAIEAFGDKHCGVGATIVEIDAAEKNIRADLPHSYRSFLHEFGWARLAHNELYGLGQDVPRHLELVRNTLAERSAMNPLLPQHLVPIMNDGAGNHYCLDTDECLDGECPVVFWDHELAADQQPSLASPCFSVWIEDILS